MRFIWVILVDTIFYRLYVNYIAFIGSRSFVSDWVFHSCHISFRFAIRIYLLYCLYIILIYPEICKIVSFDQVCRLYANSFQRQSYSIFIHFVPFNFNIVRICTLNVFISFFEVRKEIKYFLFFFLTVVGRHSSNPVIYLNSRLVFIDLMSMVNIDLWCRLVFLRRRFRSTTIFVCSTNFQTRVL